MKSSAAAAILLLAALLGPTRTVRSEERVELSGQSGIELPILYDAAAKPTASVILFVGGDGKLADEAGSFLLRVRARFVAAGMSVAVPDTPSDHPGGFGPFFRTWTAYAEDEAAIVAFLNGKAPVPVWVVGTSNGTISAASAATQLAPGAIAGVVLTSSVWLDALRLVPVEKIAVPVLDLQDREDACPVSRLPLSEQNFPRLKAAPAKQLVIIVGPDGKGERCGNDSGHDFYGVDGKAAVTIIDWIKVHDRDSPRR